MRTIMRYVLSLPLLISFSGIQYANFFIGISLSPGPVTRYISSSRLIYQLHLTMNDLFSFVCLVESIAENFGESICVFDKAHDRE